MVLVVLFVVIIPAFVAFALYRDRKLGDEMPNASSYRLGYFLSACLGLFAVILLMQMFNNLAADVSTALTAVMLVCAAAGAWGIFIRRRYGWICLAVASVYVAGPLVIIAWAFGGPAPWVVNVSLLALVVMISRYARKRWNELSDPNLDEESRKPTTPGRAELKPLSPLEPPGTTPERL